MTDFIYGFAFSQKKLLLLLFTLCWTHFLQCYFVQEEREVPNNAKVNMWSTVSRSLNEINFINQDISSESKLDLLSQSNNDTSECKGNEFIAQIRHIILWL